MKSDCAVRALSLALGVDYTHVVNTLAPYGYRVGRGFDLGRWIACQEHPAIGEPEHVFGYSATWMPTPAVRGEARLTVNSFAAAYPHGAWIVRQAHHFCAVRDGAVLMEARRPDGGGCVYGAWRFNALDGRTA